MKELLYVMLGGSIGAAMRYLVGVLCTQLRLNSLPVATFLVNILGCFLLGILTGIGERHFFISKEMHILLTVGVCGAFTTFSTFSGDTIRLMEQGHWLIAISYVTLSIILGFAVFFVGKSPI